MSMPAEKKFIHEIQLLKKFPEVAIGRNVISNDYVIKIWGI